MTDQDKESTKISELIGYEKNNVWDKLAEGEKELIFDFCGDYKNFLDISKTEREAVKNIISSAVGRGFADINQGENKNGKYYYNYRGKIAVLARLNGNSLARGLKIVAAHVDAPRLDLKQNPLYEEQDIALLKTHY